MNSNLIQENLPGNNNRPIWIIFKDFRAGNIILQNLLIKNRTTKNVTCAFFNINSYACEHINTDVYQNDFLNVCDKFELAGVVPHFNYEDLFMQDTTHLQRDSHRLTINQFVQYGKEKGFVSGDIDIVFANNKLYFELQELAEKLDTVDNFYETIDAGYPAIKDYYSSANIDFQASDIRINKEYDKTYFVIKDALNLDFCYFPLKDFTNTDIKNLYEQ
jgi:hypothetical protein